MTPGLTPPIATTAERPRLSEEQLSALLDLSRALASELDVDSLLGAILAHAAELLDADRGTIFLVDPQSGALWSRMGHGVSDLRIPRGAGIAGYVAATGQVVNVPDAYGDPRFLREVDEQTGYRTHNLLCVPIRDRSGGVAGVLEVLNKRGGAFDAADELLLTTLAAHASVALTNAWLMEARRQEVVRSNVLLARTSLLLDMMRSLSSELSLDQLLALIMRKTAEVLRADRSALFLVDQRTGELWFKVALGAELREVRIPPGVGIAGYVVATGKVVNIPDAYADPRFNQDVDRRSGYRTQTILCAPMRNATGAIVGALQVLNREGGQFTREDEDLIQALGSQAAIALQNAGLFEEVVRVKNYNESILRSMAAGVVALDVGGSVTSANPAARRILGLEALSVGLDLEAALDAQGNSDLWAPIGAALGQHEPRQALRVPYTRPDSGHASTLDVSAVPLRDHRDAVVGVVTVLEDVSREQQLAGTLSRMVGRQVADQVLAQGRLPRTGGERRSVTVLIADIRNFTVLSESSEPEEIVSMLNDYFSRMLDVIFKYEGTIDKFMGDAIMAVFGTPIAHDDDPLRAILAAVEMRRALRQFNAERTAAGKPALRVGIGLCSGEAVCGAVGSEERLEFTVIGDTVNTASALEARTKSSPDHKILFNEGVYDWARGRLPCQFLGAEAIKGKARPVQIYGIPEWFFTREEAADTPVVGEGGAPMPAPPRPIFGRLLIADDSPLVRQMVGDALRPDCETVMHAQDGLEAVAMAIAERPDLLLLDVQMPGLDGLEVCRRLRQQADLADMPIVILTSSDAETDVRAAFEAGANDYLIKPLTPGQLRARLRTLMLRGTTV